MLEIKRNAEKTLTLTTTGSATNVKVTVTHFFGDVVVDAATASGSGTNWTYDLTADDTEACGNHKVTWEYTLGGESKRRTDSFYVFQPYTTEAALLLDYPELDGKTDTFVTAEKLIRRVIDTYCGQSFESYPNKTMRIDGDGSNILHLWHRIDHLTKVLVDGDVNSDITDYVEISRDSPFYLQKKSIRYGSGKSDNFSKWFSDISTTDRLFSKKHHYHILGDFGWNAVPINVVEASKILLADHYNQDSVHRKHSIYFSGIGPVQTNYNTDFMGTTGNIDADVLLMDYTKFILDYIG